MSNQELRRRRVARSSRLLVGLVAGACSSPRSDETPELGTARQALVVDCRGLPRIDAIAGVPTNGTNASECIVGTTGPDDIDGRGGDDLIFGLEGDDAINGGNGDDEIDGGEGDDVLEGGPGDDLIDGGPGADEVTGGPGDDILRGGSGDDPLIDGGPQNDAIFGDEGNDTLRGGPGDDYLDGRQGDDALFGETGDDELVGGPGTDALDGGNQGDVCNEAGSPTVGCEATSYGRGSVVVANRGTNDLSVIDVQSGAAVKSVALPDNGEPMYLTYSPQNSYLFVADRANSRAVVFDAKTLDHVTNVPLGAGVFHCWIDRTEGQLWVTNDIDDTASVIDTRKLTVKTTVAMPPDLVADGYFPHDVTLGRQQDDVFVSLIGGTQGGVVLRYSSKTFTETARRFLGDDPHVTLRRYLPNLAYINSQGAGSVLLIDRDTLADVAPSIAVANAHGAVMNTEYETQFVYTTNIAGGGVGGLVTIDSTSQAVVATTDTPFPVPHNIVLDPSGARLYVTHSGGSANQVSIYDVNLATGAPTLTSSVTVGLNPFGLTHIPFEF